MTRGFLPTWSCPGFVDTSVHQIGAAPDRRHRSRGGRLWRENYDLSAILQRDWKMLGPKLAGKLNIYVGDMDNYYMDNAVYLMEDFFEKADPPYGGEVKYCDRFEQCWNGDPDQPNAISRLRYHQMYAPKIVERIIKSALAGADLKSWRY